MKGMSDFDRNFARQSKRFNTTFTMVKILIVIVFVGILASSVILGWALLTGKITLEQFIILTGRARYLVIQGNP